MFRVFAHIRPYYRTSCYTSLLAHVTGTRLWNARTRTHLSVQRGHRHTDTFCGSCRSRICGSPSCWFAPESSPQLVQTPSHRPTPTSSVHLFFPPSKYILVCAAIIDHAVSWLPHGLRPRMLTVPPTFSPTVYLFCRDPWIRKSQKMANVEPKSENGKC